MGGYTCLRLAYVVRWIHSTFRFALHSRSPPLLVLVHSSHGGRFRLASAVRWLHWSGAGVIQVALAMALGSWLCAPAFAALTLCWPRIGLRWALDLDI
jgi:hypothetical protein